MKPINTTELDNILNTFLVDNDFECTVEMDTDFAYYYASSVITYSLIVSERMDRLFLDFAKRNGLNVDCGIFLLSFFHELGHDQTIEDIDDTECAYCADVKATLGDSDKDCEVYFNLTDELEATLWAIDYINNNIEKIAELAKNIQKAIDNLLN